MGEARRRGSFEERKAQAIKEGRIPEIRRRLQRQSRSQRAEAKATYRAYIGKLLELKQAAEAGHG